MTQFKPADFVITARFDDFDDYHLQLLHGDQVLVTVCEPAGPGGQQEFCLYLGDGLDPTTDEESTPLSTFYTKHASSADENWRRAVRTAYQYAANYMS